MQDIQAFESAITVTKYKDLLTTFVDAAKSTSNGLPVHLALLKLRTDLSPRARQSMMQTYLGGIVKEVGDYLNRVVMVLGCTVYEHPPYIGQDGEEHPSYYKLYIKTALTETVKGFDESTDRAIRIESNIIIATSSIAIVDFFLGQIAVNDEVYDFKEPFKVFFTGTKNSGYKLQLIDDPEVGETMEHVANNH